MISEDSITKHLNFHLMQSKPGAMLHHLSVIAAPHHAFNALGLVDEAKTEVSMYALVPIGPDVNQLIADAAASATAQAARVGHVILLAVLSQENWIVGHIDAHGRELAAQGRLEEHPNAVEATAMYAAGRDGRRWRGRRYLTGAKAGTTEHVEMIVGRPQHRESRGVSAEVYIRRLVGL